MSDTDGKKTLGLRGGARPGNVIQSFSHGRTKNVVVETKRKRVVVPKPGATKPSGGAAPAKSSRRGSGTNVSANSGATRRGKYGWARSVTAIPSS